MTFAGLSGVGTGSKMACSGRAVNWCHSHFRITDRRYCAMRAISAIAPGCRLAHGRLVHVPVSLLLLELQRVPRWAIDGRGGGGGITVTITSIGTG
jgi:hypothetical protein